MGRKIETYPNGDIKSETFFVNDKKDRMVGYLEGEIKDYEISYHPNESVYRTTRYYPGGIKMKFIQTFDDKGRLHGDSAHVELGLDGNYVVCIPYTNGKIGHGNDKHRCNYHDIVDGAKRSFVIREGGNIARYREGEFSCDIVDGKPVIPKGEEGNPVYNFEVKIEGNRVVKNDITIPSKQEVVPDTDFNTSLTNFIKTNLGEAKEGIHKVGKRFIRIKMNGYQVRKIEFL